MSQSAASSITKNGNGTGVNHFAAGSRAQSYSGSMADSKDMKKWMRMAIVLLYLVGVSLASAVLAVYYLWLWDAKVVYARFNVNSTEGMLSPTLNDSAATTISSVNQSTDFVYSNSSTMAVLDNTMSPTDGHLFSNATGQT